MQINKYYILIFISLFFNSIFSQVTQEADTLKVYHLQEVVVYGQKNTFKPSLITEMDIKEIRSRAGSTTADMLRMDSGLSVTSGGKAETRTRIRGFESSSVLVLVDGRPINPGYYGAADLSMLPRDQIAKIKVIKGPASVAYGANAMGGVINIITENTSGKPVTSLDTEMDYFGQRRIALAHIGGIGKFRYHFSGYEHASDGFRLSDYFHPTEIQGKGKRENSAYRKRGGSVKLSYNPNAMQDYMLSAVYHRAKRDVPWSVDAGQARYRRFPRWERYGLSLSGSWKLQQNLKMKSIIYGDAYHDRFQDYRRLPMTEDNLRFDSLLKNWTLGSSLDLQWEPHRKHQIHAGLIVRRDWLDKQDNIGEPWNSRAHFTGTLFVEERFAPFEPLQFTVGISGHIFENDSRDEAIFPVTPMMSVSWKMPWEFELYCSWAKAVRFPTMHQLYSQSAGNPNLKPEFASKTEMGLSRPFRFSFAGGLYGVIEAAVFNNELDNLIYRESRAHRLRNIRTASLAGVELRISGQWTSMIQFQASYGHIRADKSTKEMMEEVPEHQWAAQVAARLPWEMHLRYEYSWHDQRTTSTEDLYLHPYRVHHLTLSRSFGESMEVFIRGMNVTDADYQEEDGYPAAGRTISAGFSVRY